MTAPRSPEPSPPLASDEAASDERDRPPSEPPSGEPPRGDLAPSSEPPSAAGTDPGVGAASDPPPILPEFPRGSVLWRIGGMVREVRPSQWVKNAFVLAPLVFAKHLTHPSVLISAAGAFGVFCLLAGAVYTMNDLVDVEADRVHPVKRRRPIASGRVPVPVAKVMVVVLLIAAFGGALLGPWQFAALAAAYLVNNLAYTFFLKKIAYVDVGSIALGFVLRVLAGGYAIKTPVSWYMLACTALLALFLGFGKRRHEIAQINAGKQRAALEAYHPRVLDVALAVTGLGAMVVYVAYTIDPSTRALFDSEWLWVTTIHPIFGVIRFLQLVSGRPKAESPTQEMLRDVPFVLNLVLYTLEIVFIVYRLRPS